MSESVTWSTPQLIVLGAGVDDSRNGGPTAAAIDAGSDVYAS